jgi:hypothetical protein
MMKTLRKIAGAVSLTCVITLLNAHHSTSMFDRGREVQVEGVIRQVQWTNPHGWLMVVTSTADGGTTEWAIETAPPSMLERSGIHRADFKTGERVTVVTNPIKDGKPIGLFVSLKRADGSVVKPRRE